MKRLFSWVSTGVGLTLAGVLSAGGCTSHGEGGRCDPTNKDQTTGAFADCDSNLNCTSGLLLSLPEGGQVSGFICCPFDRSQATTDICRGSPPSPDSDASIPEGGFETGAKDATNDQSTSDVIVDAPNESSTTDSGDAASDATGE